MSKKQYNKNMGSFKSEVQKMRNKKPKHHFGEKGYELINLLEKIILTTAFRQEGKMLNKVSRAVNVTNGQNSISSL